MRGSQDRRLRIAASGAESAARPRSPTDDHRTLLQTAAILAASGRHREVLHILIEARSAGAGGAEFLYRLGLAFAAVGRTDEAIAAMHGACADQPSHPLSRTALGELLDSAGQHDAAVDEFNAVLAARPDDPAALLVLGRSLVEHGDAAKGEAVARRVLEMDADCREALTLCGVAALKLNRPADALRHFESVQTLAEEREGCELFDQEAVALNDLGRTSEVIEKLSRALPGRPSPNAHFAYAIALLTEDRQREGWAQFEYRWYFGPLAGQRRNYGKPVWAGQDLKGKTIYVMAEQGYGDVFQMLRYLPLLKARGATVLLQPIVELQSMYSQLPGVDAVVAEDRPVPPFDYWIYLMSLPHAFGTTSATIPREIPYLRADVGRTARWAPRIPSDDKLNVGIVWSGSPAQRVNERRSLSLSRWGPILGVPNVRFVALQKGPSAREPQSVPAGVELTNLGPELSDFSDTASVIDRLDLLISTCTSVPHLAGALGKPVWLMLSNPADYRWLKDRNDSPWYPTMRLYRQRAPGQWSDVVERVSADLRHLAECKRNGTSQSALAALAVPGVSLASSPLREAQSAHVPESVALVAETRTGLMQYFPCTAEGRSIHWYGEYLQRSLERILRLVRPGQTILEIGAGYGSHSIPLARRVGREGHLVAVEADSVTRRVLALNLAVNQLTEVTILGQPFAPAAPLDDQGESTRVGSMAPGSAEETLDELQLERLDWLKTSPGVDAQAVLRGSEDVLWRLRPGMVLAIDDEHSAAPVADVCKHYGYRTWRFDDPYFNPTNFNCREDDIFEHHRASFVLAIPEEADVESALVSLAEI